MSVFQFKQFRLEQQEGAMKFGTDSAVLGAWAKHPHPASVLDIGTGTGVLALMLAQRYICPVDAVEIEEAAYRQAKSNFRASPWQERVQAHHTSIQQFSKTTAQQYDLIVCNPPYFNKSLLPANANRQIARHTRQLSFQALGQAVASLLSENGLFYAIIPQNQKLEFTVAFAEHGLHSIGELRVISVAGKPPFRAVLTFQHRLSSGNEPYFLPIHNEVGDYTAEYTALLKEYYLGF